MRIGIVGLGRMGGDMFRRSTKAGRLRAAFDADAEARQTLAAAGSAGGGSRREHTLGERMLSAMRFGFGGRVEGAEGLEPNPADSIPRAAE